MARVIMSTTALVVIAVFVVFPSTIMAAQYVVGDDQVWDGGADYQAWADSVTFQINDELLFVYDPSIHDVAQAATADDFDNCVSDPDLGVYTSGSDGLVITDPGTFYFLCTNHCQDDGQKFMFTVT